MGPGFISLRFFQFGSVCLQSFDLANTIEPPRSEGVGFALRRCDRRSDTEASNISHDRGLLLFNISHDRGLLLLQFECEPSDIMSI